MLIETRLFGNIEIEDEKILTFPSGLIGMKHLKRFVILDKANERPFQWMVSLDDPNISFLVLEPQIFRPDYKVAIQKDELTQLGITKNTEVLVLCIVTLYKEPKALTANLQGPLIINAENRIGKQVILVEGHYTARHDIVEEMKQAGGAGDKRSPKEILEIKNSK